MLYLTVSQSPKWPNIKILWVLYRDQLMGGFGSFTWSGASKIERNDSLVKLSKASTKAFVLYVKVGYFA